MPVHTNSIGAFEFHAMDGVIFYRQQEIETITRAGVNGSGARRLGEHGKEFELTTVNYEATLQAAANKMDDYITMKNSSDLVAIVHNDVPEGFYLLLEVRERARFAIMSAIGGLVPGGECQHEVTWKFLG